MPPDAVYADGGVTTFTIDAGNGDVPDASQSFTLTIEETPTITSAPSATFTVGTYGIFTVTTVGYPVPSFNTGVVLPAGVNYSDNGDGTATISGTPSPGTVGTYNFQNIASNGNNPDATQNFTLTVNEAPTITSDNNTYFLVGNPGSFTVTTAGYPTATIDDGGATLPNGMTFVDNGDGTATISGTPAAGTGGDHLFTITASNGESPDASQAFTLTIGQAPVITSAPNTTFTVGVAGTFTVTTTGWYPPNLAAWPPSQLPAGVTFVDNFDGTMTMSGTPVTSGVYVFTIYANNGVAPNTTQVFTLTVAGPPTITSANHQLYCGQCGDVHGDQHRDTACQPVGRRCGAAQRGDLR